MTSAGETSAGGLGAGGKPKGSPVLGCQPQLMPPPCLVRARCLGAVGHPIGAHESGGMIVLDVLHVLQCPAGPGHGGNWHRSCVCLSSGISQPYKSIARVFLPRILFRVFETLLKTKLVEINAFAFHNNMHMVPSGCMVWCLVQNRFGQNSLSDHPSYFVICTMSNMCHFLLQPVKPIMYESVVHFLKLQ